MGLLYPTLAAVLGLRLTELALARRNTVRLLARGGREVGARHYPLFLLLHGGWLAAIAAVGDVEPRWPMLLGLFALLQPARGWVIWNLGEYWTTRIITVDGAPLVRRGPYRWCRHPNYVLVALEIPLLPLAFGAWRVALLFALLNALLLWHRIRVETEVLATR
jgi:methyltransferase